MKRLAADGGIAYIKSRGNPQFKALRELVSSARERNRQRRTILDGPHLVLSYIARGGVPSLVAVSEPALANAEIQSLLARPGREPVLCFDAELFRQLAPVDTPVGILAVIEMPREDASAALGQLVVMLDRVQDPGNVGAIIRSAAAVGADDVLLSAGCADAWAPRTLRAAMGAHFALRVRAGANLLDAMQWFAGTTIAASGGSAKPPYRLDMRGQVALIFGNEGTGVSIELQRAAKLSVSIPMQPGIESLNVAAAAAILLYERHRQLAMAR